MFNFIRNACFDVQRKGIERKLATLKLLLDSGINENSDRIVELKIEVAEDVAHFKSIYGD